MKSLALVWIIALLSAPLALLGAEPKMESILRLYKKGDYVEALNELKQIENTAHLQGTVFYWEGIIHKKLQEYDAAIVAYEKAIEAKADFQDLEYEYGQALYAADQLAKARRAFGESIKRRYKVATSLYYVAFIAQTLNDTAMAVKYYKKVAELPKDMREDVEQSSQYQLGEIYYVEAKTRPDRLKAVRKIVIPQFEEALSIDRSSTLAAEIEKRIYEIKKENALIVTEMINGRPLPQQRWNLVLSEEFKYDSNVIYEADEATQKAQNKDSNVSKSTFFGRYRFTLLNIAQLTPDFRADRTYHASNRTDPNIYKNDNYNLAPALRTSWEHMLFDKMAAFLFDVEYNYSAKDVNAKKNLEYNSRSITFAAGESATPMKMGETTLKLKRRHTYSYQVSSNAYTNTVNLTQMIGLPKGHMLIAIANANYLRSNSVTNDNDSYNLVLNYVIPELGPFITPTLGFSYTYTDTKKQSAARGMEKNYNPSFRISKLFKQKFKVTALADYTDQVSRDKSSYAYTKWTAGAEFSYNF